MSLLVLDRVSKVFGHKPKSIIPLLSGCLDKQQILNQTGHVVGLREVTLEIDAGEIFVIMGLSGSGKSTLIRHLNRLIEPTSGEIRLHGENILNANKAKLQKIRQTKMSMVFQRFGLMPHRTVLDNVAFGLEARGEPRNTRLAKARNWISRVGLEGYEASYPAALSGGMQQRVGLARGLATSPDVLLMDEAFSALDPLIRRDMQKVLLELQKEINKTIVFITHDLDEALAIGDRIAILQDGRLIQIGRPSEIILTPAVDYVARFVANVNRGRILKVSDIMGEPRPGVAANSTLASATLECALTGVLSAREGLHVESSDGNLVGFLQADRLISTIVSAQSKLPNIGLNRCVEGSERSGVFSAFP